VIKGMPYGSDDWTDDVIKNLLHDRFDQFTFVGMRGARISGSGAGGTKTDGAG
jgi:hypothetical protein